MIELSSLGLAYLGDAVFELLVRRHIVAKKPVHALHNEAKSFVSATAQAKMYKKILPFLTEQELAVSKRARNAKVTKRKSSTLAEYHHATALEAIFGYHYITGDEKRIEELFNLCIRHPEREEETNAD